MWCANIPWSTWFADLLSLGVAIRGRVGHRRRRLLLLGLAHILALLALAGFGWGRAIPVGSRRHVGCKAGQRATARQGGDGRGAGRVAGNMDVVGRIGRPGRRAELGRGVGGRNTMVCGGHCGAATPRSQNTSRPRSQQPRARVRGSTGRRSAGRPSARVQQCTHAGRARSAQQSAGRDAALPGGRGRCERVVML